MDTKALCEALCAITDALAAECQRLRFSPHKLALEAIRERLDVLLDALLDGAAQDRGDAGTGGEP